MQCTRLLVVAAAAMLVGSSALAAGPKHKVKHPAPKLTAVRVCPITGEAVKGKGGGNEVVGKYRVYFCCAACKAPFDKLSKANKLKKVQVALRTKKAAHAGHHPSAAKSMHAAQDVQVCPISGKQVEGEGASVETVGQYRVHFCCPNCQPAFDKLTDQEKQEKIAAALKR